MFKRYITMIVFGITTCYIMTTAFSGLKAIVVILLLAGIAFDVFCIATYHDRSRDKIIMSFRELKKFLEISPQTYEIDKFTIVFKMYEKNGDIYFIGIFFDSIWSNILYIIYRYKHINDDMKEKYLNLVVEDIEKLKKESDRMINEAKKTLEKYNLEV